MTEVKVLLVRIEDFQEDDIKLLLKYVSIDKQQKYSCRVLSKSNFLSIVGEVCLRFLVQEQYGIRYDNISFFHNENGKPAIESFEHIKFNISHSNDVVAIALTFGCNIGIDIEKIKSYSINIIDRFYSKEEQNMIKQLSSEEKNYAFYRIWTMKESFIKSKGEGIFNTNLSLISMAKFCGKEFFYRKRIGNYYMKVSSVYKNYLLSVCADTPNIKIVKKISNLDEVKKNLKRIST